MSTMAACSSQRSDVIAGDVRAIGKLFLRQALGLPQATQILHDDLP